MLRLVRQKLRKLLAPAKVRYETSRLRPGLERLEDRAMLSASSNSMSHARGIGNGNGNAYGHDKGVGARAIEQPAYTSAPQQALNSAGRQARPTPTQPAFAPAFGGIQDQQPPPAVHYNELSRSVDSFPDRGSNSGSSYDPPAQEQFAPPTPRLQSRGLQSRPLVDSFADRGSNAGPYYDPPLQETIAPAARQPSYDTSLLYEPVWEQPIFVATSPYRDVAVGRPGPAQPDFRIPSTSVFSPPPVTQLTYVIVVERIVAPTIATKPVGDLPSSLYGSLELPHNPIPSASGVLAMASSNNYVLPVAATDQPVAHEGSTAAILAATARDLVFKDYAPNLLLLSSSSFVDRSTLALVNTEARPADGLDGFILPYETSFLDDIVHSADAVAQEREAVNAVLEQLQDVDSPQLPERPAGEDAIAGAANRDLDLRLDLLDAESVVNEMPAGEIQGGMVLLPSTGDANESKFDLTPVYAEQVERSVAPIVETSVGLFQAIDGMADDSMAPENAPPSVSSLLPHGDALLNDPPPAERAPSTSRKAAALLGAAATTGAMVWMSCGSGQHDVVETRMPKRRRKHVASSR
jgi:hypothetical protein